MRNLWFGSMLVLALVVAACGASVSPSANDASVPALSEVTAVINATVYTVDESQPWAEAFAYDANGRIVAVGTEGQVLAAAQQLVGAQPEIIDADGQLVLPGFQDVHVHVPEAGLNTDVCYFPDGLTLDDYEELAVECGEEQGDADWVRGAGASLFDLRGSNESPLAVLDRAIPDRPALILDNLGHAIWTNSAGLAAAGIGVDDPDPQGGVFHRDSDGELTGLILEDAQQLVRNAAALDDEVNYQGLLIALDELAANGVTTVSDAGGYWAQNHPAAWERALVEGTLTVRGMNSLYLYPDLDVDAQLTEFTDRLSDDAESMLQFDTAKVYIDGILDLGTALLLEPYNAPIDDNYPSGFAYFEQSQLDEYVNELHQLGYRISFHVIGDAAVRQALDAIEAIDASPAEIADRRHRTTHTYLVHADDLGRFSEIGVVADFQQSEDAIVTDYHDFLAEFIGERAYDLIPTASVLAAGASVTLSSDWDAGPLPPLGTIERSLTRDANAVPDIETAVALATIDAAYALGHDERTGSIEVGKQADFVMLDRNVFDGSTTQIDDAQVMLTVVDGVIVFEDT